MTMETRLFQQEIHLHTNGEFSRCEVLVHWKEWKLHFLAMSLSLSKISSKPSEATDQKHSAFTGAEQNTATLGRWPCRAQIHQTIYHETKSFNHILPKNETTKCPPPLINSYPPSTNLPPTPKPFWISHKKNIFLVPLKALINHAHPSPTHPIPSNPVRFRRWTSSNHVIRWNPKEMQRPPPQLFTWSVIPGLVSG